MACLVSFSKRELSFSGNSRNNSIWIGKRLRTANICESISWLSLLYVRELLQNNMYSLRRIKRPGYFLAVPHVDGAVSTVFGKCMTWETECTKT